MISPLYIATYNCRGWNYSSPYVAKIMCYPFTSRTLVNFCAISLVNLNIDVHYLAIGVSGMDSSKLLPGCPYGGCVILFCKSIFASLCYYSTVQL